MKHKKMLGETIYKLRKQKGISQSELGKLVGVSNKAVSKWETDEANPDINLLPALADALGVTCDQLLDDVKTDKNSLKPKEGKVGRMKGTIINTSEEYEFVSDKKTKKGKPYVHIHFGKTANTINAKARGVIAIGNNAKGLISIGLISSGLISIGLLSFGLIAGGLLCFGLIALGSIAIGGAALGGVAIGIVAAGGVAVGVIAFGGVAIGYISYGGLSIGYYAHTGLMGRAIGKRTFYH